MSVTEKLVIQNLTKSFPSGDGVLHAVADVSFEVEAGEFFTMLGPSGCGKTTTLRMISGLETVSSGEISFGDRNYTSVPARDRNIGMVFQSYALFPHLSVFENVAYGLRLRRTPNGETATRVRDVLDLLQLSALAERTPGQLSGGQQQRVSIARALVYQPKLLLLDEPLANLDAKLRVQMREEIRALQRRLGITAIYVTHDQEEAMSISDRIAVFNRGKLAQLGAPYEIYAHPTSLFVADFIGRANFLPVEVDEPTEDRPTVRLPGGVSVRPAKSVRVAEDEAASIPAGAVGCLMVRPERLTLERQGGQVPVTVHRKEFLGPIVRYMVKAEGVPGDIVVDLSRPADGIEEGDVAVAGFAPDDATLFLRGGSM